jgi:hypothetical protein
MAFVIRYSEEKNELLRAKRGICFDDILDQIEKGELLDDKQHPSKDKNHQRVYVVKVGNYAFVVPYIINPEKKEIFLKTVYASRKYTKQYIKKGDL